MQKYELALQGKKEGEREGKREENRGKREGEKGKREGKGPKGKGKGQKGREKRQEGRENFFRSLRDSEKKYYSEKGGGQKMSLTTNIHPCKKKSQKSPNLGISKMLSAFFELTILPEFCSDFVNRQS